MTASSSFAQSRKRDPKLETEETSEQLKDRVLGVIEKVVFNGLTIRDGEMTIGLNMNIAKIAADGLSDNDRAVIDHSNDPLVKSASNFLTEWGQFHL